MRLFSHLPRHLHTSHHRTCKPAAATFAAVMAFATATFMVLGTGNTLAQTSSERPSNLRYGLFGSYNFNRHTVDFKEFAPSCCPQLFPATQNGSLTLGGLAEFPIIGPLGVGIRASYSPLPTTFSVTTTSPFRTRIGSPNGEPRTVPITYLMETSLGSIDVEPLITVRPFGGLSVYAGARGSYFLQSSFKQYERIDDPNVTYENGTNTRGETSGRIPNVRAFTPWLVGGISYEIPLNSKGTILLAPEAFYMFPLSSVLTDQTWKISSIRAGISLRFAPVLETKPEIAPQTAPRDAKPSANTPRENRDTREPRKEEKLATGVFAAKVLSVAAASVSAASSNNANFFVEVEEFEMTRSRPLLPVVFFDEKSADIPARYQKLKPADRARFQFESLTKDDPLSGYYHVLNVLGKRLGLYQQAKVTLVGYADAGREQNTAKLATQRAEKIKAYLKDVWKVDDKRITVKAGDNAGAANASGAAAEEQRRVEIVSDIPDVVDELRFNERHRTVKPQSLTIKIDIQSPAGLRDWRLEAVQAGEKMRKLKVFRGTDTYPKTLEWNLSSATPDSLPQTQDDIALRLEATDKEGKTARAPFVFVPSVRVTPESKKEDGEPDERTDSYNVFGNNTPKAFTDADPTAMRFVSKIKPTIKANSIVTITGYSDTSGNAQADAERYAQAVAKLLNAPKATVAGKGASVLHDNGLPEGRWHNRFVQVEIRTPVNN